MDWNGPVLFRCFCLILHRQTKNSQLIEIYEEVKFIISKLLILFRSKKYN